MRLVPLREIAGNARGTDWLDDSHPSRFINIVPNRNITIDPNKYTDARDRVFYNFTCNIFNSGP